MKRKAEAIAEIEERYERRKAEIEERHERRKAAKVAAEDSAPRPFLVPAWLLYSDSEEEADVLPPPPGHADASNVATDANTNVATDASADVAADATNATDASTVVAADASADASTVVAADATNATDASTVVAADATNATDASTVVASAVVATNASTVNTSLTTILGREIAAFAGNRDIPTAITDAIANNPDIITAAITDSITNDPATAKALTNFVANAIANPEANAAIVEALHLQFVAHTEAGDIATNLLGRAPTVAPWNHTPPRPP